VQDCRKRRFKTKGAKAVESTNPDVSSMTIWAGVPDEVDSETLKKMGAPAGGSAGETLQ
jgi:hypothetical protein